jgi:hypothetical protein
LLIALFLVGMCVLPIANFPSSALQAEIKSAYRLEMHRLGDLAFAQFKEDAYKKKISWEQIAHSANERATLADKDVEITFDKVGGKKFKRLSTVHSIKKKDKQGEEWRLATFTIKFIPLNTGFKLFKSKDDSCTFTYKLLFHKAPVSTQKPQEMPPPA